jgi:uncharacterized protein YjiS (DUF1127 family)
MRQALEISRLPQCRGPRTGWLGRVRAWLSDRDDRKRITALERFSPHLLRDIGLTRDARSIRLLQEHHSVRR